MGTRKQHEALWRTRTNLFPGGAGSSAVHVTLWPNGEPAIWLSDTRGVLGVAITAGNGPYGLGVRLRAFVGTPGIDAMSSEDGNALWVPSREVGTCQYYSDARSQAFRRWYRHEEMTEDVALLGPRYQR